MQPRSLPTYRYTSTMCYVANSYIGKSVLLILGQTAYTLIDRSHYSAEEHRVSTRILHFSLFLASVLISAQGLFNSFGFFEHRSSLCIPRSAPPSPFAVVIPLYGLPVVGRFSQCMAQPPPLAFPDMQIYSRLLRELTQLFVRKLVRPENFQYFSLGI